MRVLHLDRKSLYNIEQCLVKRMCPADRYLFMLRKPVESGKTLYKCSFCGSKDVKMLDVQTRKADEATDVFLVCASCGRRRKL